MSDQLKAENEALLRENERLLREVDYGRIELIQRKIQHEKALEMAWNAYGVAIDGLRAKLDAATKNG